MKPEYIDRLHVENIGPFDKLDVAFSPNLNVLVGGNGSGKTSILRCITHCFTSDNREYFRYRVGAKLYTYFMKDGKKSKCGGIPYGIKNDLHYHQMVPSMYEVDSENDDAERLMHTQYPYNILAIGAHRYFDYVKIQGMRSEVNPADQRRSYSHNNPLYIDNALLPDIKQWMVNRYFIVDKEWGKDLKNNWETILNKIPALAPPNHKLSFARVEEDLNPIFTLDDNECYLEELSSGFKSVLSIVFSIVNWIEGVNEGEQRNIDKACGTVLIDEIEAHLHPAWQKTILSAVTQLFPNLQFIVTTHSPYVIASAEKNQVILIPALSKQMDLKPLEQDYSGWRIEYILKELMGAPDNYSCKLPELLQSLNEAINKNDKEGFYNYFNQLKGILNPDDSVLYNYEMRGAEIFSEQ